jgi:hypothetical protein
VSCSNKRRYSPGLIQITTCPSPQQFLFIPLDLSINLRTTQGFVILLLRWSKWVFKVFDASFSFRASPRQPLGHLDCDYSCYEQIGQGRRARIRERRPTWSQSRCGNSLDQPQEVQKTGNLICGRKIRVSLPRIMAAKGAYVGRVIIGLGRVSNGHDDASSGSYRENQVEAFFTLTSFWILTEAANHWAIHGKVPLSLDESRPIVLTHAPCVYSSQ